MKGLLRIFTPTEKNAENERRAELERRCTALEEQLRDVRSRFELAEEPDIIDALIFEENAVLRRLSQVYKEAREEGVSIQVHERTGR